jgi:predicted proteasome-type protease
MRLYLIAVVSLLTACNRSDRDQQVAQCVDIYRTAYVTGGVRECLVKKYGWSEADASKAQRDLDSHPDSAAHGDSGQVGDSLRK